MIKIDFANLQKHYRLHQKGDFPICEKVSNEIMSLPMNPYLSDEEISYIANNLCKNIN